MRIPAFFAAATFFLGAGQIHAQDLQYRVITHMDMPGMPVAQSSPTMTMYVKGNALRIDVEMAPPGAAPVNTSVIMDKAAHRMVVLDRSQKTYFERPFDLPGVGPDSAALAKLRGDFHPQVRKTDDIQQINGYPTRRFVISADVGTVPSLPGLETKAGMKLVIVSEQWLNEDAKLAEAYRAFAQSMAMGRDADPMNLIMTQAPGFPIKTTVLMLQLPKESSYDADALLKAGDKGNGVLMSMVSEAQDIRTSELDASLFVVPPGFTRQ